MTRRLPFVLALAVVLPAPLLAQPGKKLALLVSVREYNHSELPNLTYTENDVTELAAILKDNGFAVALLTDTTGRTSRQKIPTLANIRRELTALLKDATKHDTVLVGLAGHGVQPDAKECYFCPRDARPKDPTTLLPLNALIGELSDSGVGVKLLLVDACRNDPDPNRGRGIDGTRLTALPKGVAALFSCSAGQRAFETPKLKHGVFFHQVIDGLKGNAGTNAAGEVTWSKLADYVQETVPGLVVKHIGADAVQVPHEVKNLTGLAPGLARVAAKPTGPRLDVSRLVPRMTPLVINNASVKDELKLTDAQKEKLSALISEYTAAMKEMIKSGSGLTADQRAEAAAKVAREISAKVDAVAREAMSAEQRRRLHEIAWQQWFVTAFTDADVQKTFQLSDDQIAKFKTANERYTSETRAFPKRPTGYETKLETARAEATKTIAEILTPAQKRAWDELLGKPFDLKPFSRPTRPPG